MMARVDSITSETIDIKLISNCELRIAKCYARAAFAVLPELVKIANSSQSEFRNSFYLTPPGSSRSPSANDNPNETDQDEKNDGRHDDPGPNSAPGFRGGSDVLLDLRHLILRRAPCRFASEPAASLRRRRFARVYQSAAVIKANHQRVVIKRAIACRAPFHFS